MAITSNTNKRYVSPRGKSLYARVQTPDTHFDANGVYHVDLLVDQRDATGLIQHLETILDNFYANDETIQAAIAKGRKVNRAPIYEEMQDTSLRFRFKQKAKITAKDGTVYDKHVAVFDSKVTPLSSEIGNGSIIKVSYTCNPYYTPSTRTYGVSLRLVGVQVLDLIPYDTNDDCGFTEEEGFVNQDQDTGFTPETPNTVNKCGDDCEEDVAF